jgi:hypothetical protein
LHVAADGRVAVRIKECAVAGRITVAIGITSGKNRYRLTRLNLENSVNLKSA